MLLLAHKQTAASHRRLIYGFMNMPALPAAIWGRIELGDPDGNGVRRNLSEIQSASSAMSECLTNLQKNTEKTVRAQLPDRLPN
jgi:hypothetical protein